MRYYFVIFTALLSVGCAAAPSATPAPTPQPLPTSVPAGGLLYLPLESTGTPEANPILVIEGVIIDAVLHRPVAADVYVIRAGEYRAPTPDERVLHGAARFEIQLRAQLDGWFVVRAPGYEDWKLRLQYHLRTSRKLTGPIRLRRLPGGRQIALADPFALGA